jgi:hypothetical protein
VDLRLFARVLWRFKLVVGAGFLLAVCLAVLTVAKVDLSHGTPRLAPRTQPLYASQATLLVTQNGFPWGSAIQQFTTAGSGQSPVPAGDLGRLTSLANLYVQLANSDAIRKLVVQKAPKPASILATQNYSFSPTYYSSPLPMLTITGTSTSRRNAIATAQIGVDVLTAYLKQQQVAANIDDRQRVVLQELVSPRKTTVVNATKKTLPVVVFLTVMLAVTGLAFVLENLLPRMPKAATPASAEAAPVLDTARRSA